MLDDVEDVSENPRSYQVGGWAEDHQPILNKPKAFSLDVLGDSERTEVVVVPLDLLGIPWDEFDGPENQPGELPGAWLSAVEAIETSLTGLNKPLVLALSPISRSWDALAPEARDEAGLLLLDTAWKGYCFDPQTEGDPNRLRDRFAGYVVWMVTRFQPEWVIVGQRMNRYEEKCGKAAYDGLLTYTTEAHTRLANLEQPPVTIVTVDVEDLYGYPAKAGGRCTGKTETQCFDERSELLAGIEADRLGLESYPAIALEVQSSLPQDWLTKVIQARSDLPAVVTGTSLPAVDLYTQQGVCQPILSSDEDLQRSWLDQVLTAAVKHDMEWVVWHPIQDLMPTELVTACPCPDEGEVCFYLDNLTDDSARQARRFVMGGLWSHDGTIRSAGELWTEIQQ